MSFGPFLGGKRICLGKTFVETISKIVGPTIFANFDFEFEDPLYKDYKPHNNMFNLKQPEVFVKVKQIKLY
jgi:cytochrome P450